ncbi:MAG TPA: ATP synthase F1 subunit delta [Clostridia bacterium]|nr:ATP synthase F1 subunit delta [Clostridia bacterium]
MAVFESRYARAFADVVLEMKLDPDSTVQQLRDFVALLDSAPELRGIWENPSVPGEQKRNLLDAIAARIGAARPLRNFIAVLMDHHRIAALPQIARQFEMELNQRLGRVKVEIASARALSQAEIDAVKMQVARLTGKQVTASSSIDAGLIGGVVVKLGSTVYDGSVRGQLQRLKEELSAE